jgi:putative drug exporter of the RND superfamily
LVDRLFRALGRGVVRYRWVVVIVWLLGTGVATKALPSLGSQINNNNSAFLPASAPSKLAANLAQPLTGPANQTLIQVVGVSKSGALSAADQSVFQSMTVSLRKVPTVDLVQFAGISPDGQAAQVVVLSKNSPNDVSGDKTLINRMQVVVDRAKTTDLNVHLAGQVATEVANNAQSATQGKQTQSLSLLLIIVLLLFMFRSALAPLLTLFPAAIVLVLAQSLIGGLGSLGLKISSVTQLLLIVLVLGAGTDYGLFLVFRVREEMEGGRSAHQAVEVAVSRVGESITGSASTVILALLSLSLANFGLYKDLGPPLAIGVAVMLLAGLTLLPALLAIAGRATFWPFKLREQEHQAGLWGRSAARLVRRPALSLMVGIIVFGALAVAVIGYKPGGFGGTLTAPPGTGVAAGNVAVQKHFPEASQSPTNLIMVLPKSVWSDGNRLTKATQLLRETGEFTTLAGPLDPNGTPLSPDQLVSLHNQLGSAVSLPTQEPAGTDVPASLYNAYRATARFISTGGTTVQWEAGLQAGDSSTSAAINAVPAIRAAFAKVAVKVGATDSGVAGQAPALNDVSTISDRDLKRIVPIAVVVIGIVLALVLRSLVAPLYLLASVVISYLASLGLAVIVFVYIAHQGGLTFILPFLMFIFLLALGEDYNILVMSRIREEATRLPLREAVVKAVGATGSTVTSAGLVLAGTFTVFAVVSARQPGGSSIESVGFGLAVGVLLDTFVVRTVLVPAIVTLFGRFNWWPAAMGRKQPSGGGAGAAAGGPPGVARSSGAD